MEKLIEQLRQALTDADMDDEQREAAEAALAALEEEAEEARVAAEEDESDEYEDGSREEGGAVADALTAFAETFEEVGRTLLEGQTAVLEEMTAMREAAEEEAEYRDAEEDEESDEDESESREADSDDAVSRLADSISSLEKLVKDSIPNRRGQGPDVDEDEDLDEAARIAKALEDEKNPEVRLRSVLKHSSGERPLW